VLGGRKKKGVKVGCGFLRRDGVGLTGKVEVADRFPEFYLQVGPKLAAKIKRKREGDFLDYMGDQRLPWRWRSFVVPWTHIRVWAGMKSPCESSKQWLVRLQRCPVCLIVV
jgi:hypothetical protein